MSSLQYPVCTPGFALRPAPAASEGGAATATPSPAAPAADAYKLHEDFEDEGNVLVLCTDGVGFKVQYSHLWSASVVFRSLVAGFPDIAAISPLTLWVDDASDDVWFLFRTFHLGTPSALAVDFEPSLSQFCAALELLTKYQFRPPFRAALTSKVALSEAIASRWEEEEELFESLVLAHQLRSGAIWDHILGQLPRWTSLLAGGYVAAEVGGEVHDVLVDIAAWSEAVYPFEDLEHIHVRYDGDAAVVFRDSKRPRRAEILSPLLADKVGRLSIDTSLDAEHRYA
ncbi:uncharacterized protein LOC62_07G009274 [Vanrija pseudolonga]|uniref:Uncharacterized protein n=1 Tax=Vanrija pseudolonga TaxID=143232 RepID=A0AAF0YFM7_9TREE|nr:hypothetical protein LOC62_07G009274 [Vanrija pseudolonga]